MAQKQQQKQQAHREESGYDTKVDYGEADAPAVDRELDLDGLNRKASGWVNPLALTDDGSGDDLILELSSKPK